MSASETKEQLAFKEGLYRLPDHEKDGSLLGSKCLDCGECFHPKRHVCLNCYSKNLEEIDLSKRGKISTWTITRISYPGAPVTAPFVTARVELPEKVQILSHITDIDLDSVKVGDEVELFFWKTGNDVDGKDIMAYAFKPI